MALIHFWEKPGCQTNARQRAELIASGHQVVAHDLLGEAWTEMRLLDFFMDLPVAEWFNMNAPKIKSGEIIPGMFDTTSALHAMMADHLLIRRPLMEIGSTRIVGFNLEQLALAGGQALRSVSGNCSGSPERCTDSHH